jgi:hypothetical protein
MMSEEDYKIKKDINLRKILSEKRITLIGRA